jgi:hypothetical protein
MAVDEPAPPAVPSVMPACMYANHDSSGFSQQNISTRDKWLEIRK